MIFSDLEQAGVALIASLRASIQTEFTSIWLPTQLGAIAVIALIAAGLAAILRRNFDLVTSTASWPAYLRVVARGIASHIGLLVFLALMMVMRAAIDAALAEARTYLLTVAIDLATAWFVVAILTSVIRNPVANRLVAISIWTVAALSILHLLGPVTKALDSTAIVIGGLRISPLLVLKTTVLLLIALWLAAAASNFLDRWVQGLSGLTPSAQVLIGKIMHVALLTFAIVIVLGSVGIDLTALAWFSGAVGVGLGFGLQKVVSNLVSGIILLADKSIKPGDIISVGEHFGRVVSMGARYTSVDTRDGREHLIPNEDLVTQRVVNWSYSSDFVRLEVRFNAVYASDPKTVCRVTVAAAAAVPRVLKQPEPSCNIAAFGASALEFSLDFWIRDPADGVANVRGAVLQALWDAFEREGIRIPMPGATHVVLERPKPA
jgi:small-conductance mechanosensitive channel